MGFIKIASKQDLATGENLGVRANGKEILIVNLNDKYYALGNLCTHKNCKLSDGIIEGENIKCPCHSSAFDIKTGKVMRGPANKPVPTFKIKIEGDQILVDL